MAACVEKMSTDSKENKSRKGRKALWGKNSSRNENNITLETAKELKSPAMEDEAEKENRQITPLEGGRRKRVLKNLSNKLNPSLQEELEAVRQRLEKLSMEKEKTDKLLEERDALLKEKEIQLQLKGQEQEKLQLELKKLQKMKEFKPAVQGFALEQSLRMTELSKEEKKKKKNNANRPKKPASAYILWCRDQWNQVQSENPNAVFKDMGGILGAQWKVLSAEEKKPYEEKYQNEKEAYLQVIGQERRETEGLKLLHEEQKQKTALELLDQYLQYKKDVEGNDKSKSRKKKDPSKPKHPITAFFAFSNERRAALLAEKHNVLEIAKILGEEWKNMTKEARAPYEQIAGEAKERYMQELELYKQKKAEEAVSVSKEKEEQRKVEREQALQLLKKKEKTDLLKKSMKENLQQRKQLKEKILDPNRPKKPPTSFLIFSKETRKKLAQERPGISSTTINALISVKWKELTEPEKQVWIDQAANAMAQYKKEMEEYTKSVREQTENPPESELAEHSVSTC